ncbi:hypothetical protein RJ640_017655 [Escallonia rubra]|uniref:Cyclin n=1 Tax=Escallonia rubra TaxID=112253 RepID=A0AA88QM47_9ASTE|nr:hypothetical protein RJ640_017655 [Escallonia rubra]
MGKQAVNGKAKGSKSYVILGLDDDKGVPGGRPPRVLSLLSSVLERKLQRNEKLLKASGRKDVITLFHGKRAPALSIRQYIDRIFKYSSCSPSCFVVAYIYLEKLLEQMDVCLTSLNAHRLIITSVMLAAKYIDDECYNNVYYAKIGGISIAEMNRLEMKFLVGMDFRLHVPVEMFDNYCTQLEEEAAGRGQIEQSSRICGLGRSWSSKDGASCSPTMAGYNCRAS